MFDIKNALRKLQHQDLSLEDYLTACSKDPLVYASASQRLLAAIGEPELVNTAEDPILSRIFLNRKVKMYVAFKDFYGIEPVIENIVGFLRQAAQGLEESKQILYLLGPVGSAKSSLAERLKRLVEDLPIYVLTHKGVASPVFESPLGLIPEESRQEVMDEYGIPMTAYPYTLSPWAVKRLEEDGSLDNFGVRKMFPSQTRQIAVARTEPSDDNNQDISSLVGKLDIRKLEHYSQNDPDAYSYSGALNIGNRGVVEMVEIFKAPIKTLHPLLAATQERHYLGTEAIGAIPFDGVILAHSNEHEWASFRNNNRNEAFLDRVYVIRVPYNLRVTEEVKIYEKMIHGSELRKASIAPKTLELMGWFSIFSRVQEPENSQVTTKIKVYDGEAVKEKDPNAKSIHEYQMSAGPDEGMEGMSTRFAFKILSRVFNTPEREVAANPVHLFMVLEDVIRRESLDPEREAKYLGFINEYLRPEYMKFLGKELQTAYIESYHDYGQNLFDRYLQLADFWLQNQDYRDPDTGTMMDRESLNHELEQVEKAAGISNPKDFRSEVVNFVMRQRAMDKKVEWTSYEKLREVIEAKMFSSIKDLLPVISFGSKVTTEEAEKHEAFVARMTEAGYTPDQVRLLVENYIRASRHH
jgi:serine protein kinase